MVRKGVSRNLANGVRRYHVLTPAHFRLTLWALETTQRVAVLRITLVLLLLSGPALAAEKNAFSEWLDAQPPMPQEERDAFDEAARVMYRADCHCFRFLDKADGKQREMHLPLTDKHRLILIESIRHGDIIPLGDQGDSL